MTTQTLEREEAEEVEDRDQLMMLDNALLDEVEDHARQEGRVEALADVEDTIVETLDKIEDTLDEAMSTFGTWISDLHIRLGEVEARISRVLEPFADDGPDVDMFDLLELEAELDTVVTAGKHISKATNELAQALFHLGEAPELGRTEKDEADDNVEYAYWALMKAQSDLHGWEARINETRAEAMGA